MIQATARLLKPGGQTRPLNFAAAVRL